VLLLAGSGACFFGSSPPSAIWVGLSPFGRLLFSDGLSLEDFSLVGSKFFGFLITSPSLDNPSSRGLRIPSNSIGHVAIN
jgi:hypothetical protein